MRLPLTKTDPKLLAALRRSAEAVSRMTPDEVEAMLRAQRESWVRGNMPTGDPRFD